jgi:acetoin utilization protein AcuC
VSGRAALVRCPEARIYDHGPEHPLRPQRVLLTWDLIEACGLLEREDVSVLECRSATDEEIGAVHSEAYIDATRRAGHGEDGPWGRFGYAVLDNPIFPEMHEAGAIVAGASITAAEAIHEGTAVHAFNAAGGLHHAMPERASGFCVYDDPAIAIAWLLANGVEKVAYVDLDVHHGDGVQAIFSDDPRVLTISLHESGEYLFPGTGFVTERGTGPGEGFAVNVPLHPGVTDEAWLGALRELVPPLVTAFEPKVLVTQLGCDTHSMDPLAHLRLSTRAYREAYAEMHALAHDVSDGRWLATGGGGYRWADVVPRAWTLAFAEMAGAAPLEDALPESWIEKAEFELRSAVPATFSERITWDDRFDGETEMTVDEVRRVTFPFFGLQP